MASHDRYGKNLLRQIVGDRFVSSGDLVTVQYAGKITAKIDGVIEGCCAVEIESRTDKQIRGAVVDLLCHPLPNKLLIIIPAHMYRPDESVRCCEGILDLFKKPNDLCKAVLLSGTGDEPDEETDRNIIRKALEELGSL